MHTQSCLLLLQNKPKTIQPASKQKTNKAKQNTPKQPTPPNSKQQQKHMSGPGTLSRKFGILFLVLEAGSVSAEYPEGIFLLLHNTKEQIKGRENKSVSLGLNRKIYQAYSWSHQDATFIGVFDFC